MRDFFSLKICDLWSLKSSGTTRPKTHFIPEDWNLLSIRYLMMEAWWISKSGSLTLKNSNRFDMDWHTKSLTLYKNNYLEISALLAFLNVFIQFNHYCLCVGAWIGQEWVSSWCRKNTNILVDNGRFMEDISFSFYLLCYNSFNPVADTLEILLLEKWGK